jgi:hypothetical protein
MPPGYVTEQFLIWATTIEEATVRGNILFHNNVYLNQLKQTHEDICGHAIPTFNDQLTNSRIHSAQVLQLCDVNSWTWCEVFQLGFGLFHLCLNLVWALLHIHRGSLNQTGSLTYFFTLMEKTWLGCDHPDYHALLLALTQVLDGILLNAWRCKSGYHDLGQFAATEPLSEDLIKMAGDIMRKYVTPMATPDPLDNAIPDKPDYKSSDSGSESEDYEPTAGPSTRTALEVSSTLLQDPDRDHVHQNIRLYARDLLYVAELVHAISDGDIGHIEDMLPICKTGWAPKGVQSGQSGQGPVLDRSEHLPVYRCRC